MLTTVRSIMRVRIGVIEMGRKSECWVGMAILGTGVMLASFHCCATVDVASDILNRKATCLQNIGAATRRNQGPYSLLGVRLMMKSTHVHRASCACVVCCRGVRHSVRPSVRLFVLRVAAPIFCKHVAFLFVESSGSRTKPKFLATSP